MTLFKKVLLAAGLLAAGAAVVSVVRRRFVEPTWHSTPVPVPAPGRPVEPVAHADDAAGATPDEAAADADESPHVPTTPDAPAETVILED